MYGSKENVDYCCSSTFSESLNFLGGGCYLDCRELLTAPSFTCLTGLRPCILQGWKQKLMVSSLHLQILVSSLMEMLWSLQQLPHSQEGSVHLVTCTCAFLYSTATAVNGIKRQGSFNSKLKTARSPAIQITDSFSALAETSPILQAEECKFWSL